MFIPVYVTLGVTVIQLQIKLEDRAKKNKRSMAEVHRFHRKSQCTTAYYTHTYIDAKQLNSRDQRISFVHLNSLAGC